MHPNRLNYIPHNHTPTFSLKNKSKSHISDTESSVTNPSTPIYSESHDPSFILTQPDLTDRVSSALNFLKRIGRNQTPPPTKKVKLTDYDVHYKDRLRESYVKIEAVECVRDRDEKRPAGLSIETDRHMDIEQNADQDKFQPWTPTRERIKGNEGLCATQGNSTDFYNKAPYCRLPTTPEIANQLKEKKFLFNTVDEFNPQRQNLLDFNSKKSFQSSQNENLNTILKPDPFQNALKIPETRTFTTTSGSISFNSPTITPFSTPPSDLLGNSPSHNVSSSGLSIFKPTRDSTFSASKVNSETNSLAPKDSMFGGSRINTDSSFLTPKVNADSMFPAYKQTSDSIFPAYKQTSDSIFPASSKPADSPISAQKQTNPATSLLQPSSLSSVGSVLKVYQPSIPTPSTDNKEPKKLFSSFFVENPIEIPFDDPGFDDSESGEANSEPSTPKTSSKTPTFGSSVAANKQNMFSFKEKPLTPSSDTNLQSENRQDTPFFGSSSKDSTELNKPKSLFDNGNKDFNPTPSLFSQSRSQETPAFGQASQLPLFGQAPQSSLFGQPPQSQSSISGQERQPSLFSPAPQSQPSLFSPAPQSQPSLFSPAPQTQPPLFSPAPQTQSSLFSPVPQTQSSLFSPVPQLSTFSQSPQGSLFSSNPINSSFSLGLPGGNHMNSTSSPNLFSSTKSEKNENPMFPSQTAAKSLFTAPNISFSSTQSTSQSAGVSKPSNPPAIAGSFFMSNPQEIPIEEGFAQDAYEEDGVENGSSK